MEAATDMGNLRWAVP